MYTFWDLAAVSTPRGLWQIVDDELASRAQQGPAQPGPMQRWVLWGAGRFAQAALRRWQVQGLEPAYAVDSDPGKWGRFVAGIPVCRPEQLLSERNGCVVVIAAMDTPAIEAYLRNIRMPYLFAERTGEIGALPGIGLSSRRQDFEQVFSALADDKSRETFLAVTKARLFQNANFAMCGNVFTYNIACYPQYFPPDLITLTDEEDFVDCGTYDGDSIASFFTCAFRAHPHGHFRAIGFEVDPGNADRATENLSRLGLSSVEIVRAGVADKPGVVDLSEFHTCGQNGLGDILETPVVTLDEALNGRRPTFIKMDIEGFELAALRGGAKTIEVACPTLAVCSYHDTDQLLDIPLHLIDLPGQCELHMRHHSAGTLWETVCYRVPA